MHQSLTASGEELHRSYLLHDSDLRAVRPTFSMAVPQTLHSATALMYARLTELMAHVDMALTRQFSAYRPWQVALVAFMAAWALSWLAGAASRQLRSVQDKGK